MKRLFKRNKPDTEALAFHSAALDEMHAKLDGIDDRLYDVLKRLKTELGLEPRLSPPPPPPPHRLRRVK